MTNRALLFLVNGKTITVEFPAGLAEDKETAIVTNLKDAFEIAKNDLGMDEVLECGLKMILEEGTKSYGIKVTDRNTIFVQSE